MDLAGADSLDAQAATLRHLAPPQQQQAILRINQFHRVLQVQRLMQ
jgi:hypothetical protein